jgi:hypothetical protein
LDKVKPPSMEHLQTDAYYKDLVRGNAVHIAPKTKLQPDMGDGVGEGLGELMSASRKRSGVVSKDKLDKGHLRKHFFFGSAKFTFVPARLGKDGLRSDGSQGWECKCPAASGKHINKVNKPTKCKRTLHFSSPEEERTVIRHLQFWAAAWDSFHNRLTHQELRIDAEEVPILTDTADMRRIATVPSSAPVKKKTASAVPPKKKKAKSSVGLASAIVGSASATSWETPAKVGSASASSWETPPKLTVAVAKPVASSSSGSGSSSSSSSSSSDSD